jgi:photosystem II stability/assembly factor-like uncharacterized protein
MPRLLRTAVALSLLLAFSGSASADWEFRWAHPRPQGNALHGLAFPTAMRGYAVGGSGAVLRSDDGGSTWAAMQDHRTLATNLYDVIALDAGTIVAVGDKIVRSTDGGVSFAAIASPAAGRLRDLAMIPGGGLSASGASGAVVVSTDGGLTWASAGPGGAGEIRHHVWGSAAEAWVVGDGFAHHTTDAGASWAPFTSVPFFGFNEIFFASPSHLVVHGDFDRSESTDGGATWVDVPVFTDPLYRFRTLPLDSLHWLHTTFIEGAQVWETTDAGTTWTPRELRGGTAGNLDIARTPSGRIVWVSDNGDIRYSDDTLATVHQATLNYAAEAPQMPSAPILRFVDRGDGTIFVANQPNSSSYESLWARSDDGGENWIVPPETPGLYWVQAGGFADAATGVLGSYEQIRFTTDGGESWDASALPVGQRVSGLTSNGPALFLASTFSTTAAGTVFRSTDGGASWSPSGTGLAGSFQGGTIQFAQASTVFVAGRQGSVAALYRSTDAGASWTNVPMSGLPSAPMDTRWFDAAIGLAAIRTTPGGVYRTTDGGSTWAQVSAERGSQLDVRPDGTGLVWGTYATEPFRITTDSGVSWMDLATPLVEPFELLPPTVTAARLTSAGMVVGSTKNRILLGVSDAATASPPAAIGGGSIALRAAPDPFRAGTTFRFSLPQAGPVRLTVHDVTGRLVADLAGGRRTTGPQAVAWDGRDGSGRPLPSGVYFARLRTVTGVSRAKIVRLR